MYLKTAAIKWVSQERIKPMAQETNWFTVPTRRAIKGGSSITIYRRPRKQTVSLEWHRNREVQKEITCEKMLIIKNKDVKT